MEKSYKSLTIKIKVHERLQKRIKKTHRTMAGEIAYLLEVVEATEDL